MEPESNNIRILYIDDDEDDFLLLRDYLTPPDAQAKFTVDWASSYQAGLEQILRFNHDIYLVDHYLAGFSGVDLLKEAIQAGCKAPIIMITGQSDRQVDQAALDAGATDFLVKAQLDGQMLERSIRYALERYRLLNKIRDLAIRDALTGLYNRRELYRFLDYELIKSQRYKHSFSLLLMDVDHFKEINDRYGHRIGDDILQQVANSLRNHTRGCDLIARYGGDEFIIVLTETPASQALFAADRIEKVLKSRSVEVTGENGLPEKVAITLSIGMAEFPSNATSIDTLIDMADHALYQAKKLGTSHVVQYHAQPGDERGAA